MKRASSTAVPPRKSKKIRLADRTGVNAGAIGDLDSFKGSARPSAITSKPMRKTPAPKAETPGHATSSGSGARGRPWTVTVALPGSVVDNAQTHELRSTLVGQVARACAIFNVDEIVVFSSADDSGPPPNAAAVDESSSARRSKRTDGSVFMARLLQYLECPQYLRKHIFPVHPDLRHVGLLAPLDAPHHLRIDEACEYREAVVVTPGASATGATRKDSSGEGEGAGDKGAAAADSAESSVSSSVYTGLRKELKIGRALPVGTRVTLRMPGPESSNARLGNVVPPREPREALGYYWGYEVRLAKGLAAVWSECPYSGGYDVSIGTSEHGKSVLAHGSGGSHGTAEGAAEWTMPPFHHLLIVFGGVEGLEPVVAAEDDIAECEDDVSSLFDQYLNLCPNQGSRTIRTEEALLVGLSALKPHIERAGWECST